jgi:translation initiation factor 1A
MSRRASKTTKQRDLVFAEDGQTYAVVTKMLGHCRVLAKTDLGVELKCKIRGNMQKRVYINPGDWVLLAERGDLATDCVDIIAKYTPAEIAYLKRIGEIKHVPVSTEDDETGAGDDAWDFDADVDGI